MQQEQYAKESVQFQLRETSNVVERTKEIEKEEIAQTKKMKETIQKMEEKSNIQQEVLNILKVRKICYLFNESYLRYKEMKEEDKEIQKQLRETVDIFRNMSNSFVELVALKKVQR